MKKHFDITVTGKVQGVGFRYQAQEFADKINISGYARNLRDGSVFMEIEGEEKDLNSFVEWCKSDTLLASVKHMDIKSSVIKGYREFSIY